MRSLLTCTIAALIVAAPLPVIADNAPAPLASESKPEVGLKNIELSASGEMRGQFVTTEGLPLTGRTIVVIQNKTEQQVITDEAGRFVIQGLKGGTIVLNAGDSTYACRVWAHGTAPAKSLSSIAVVDGDGAAVRGNPIQNTQAYLYSLSQRQRIALGVLLATGVTIAIVESDDDGS